MNSSNSMANGGKLDDCHSSVYSLASLSGLQWRKFSYALTVPVSPCDDPVLLTFSKCLNQDILAVWRKTPGMKKSTFAMPTSHPSFHDDEAHTGLKKELWIFWWGNEDDPSVEDVGRTSGLTLESQHSYDEQGLSYECRTLLFKAIHNLIEKCLLAEKFVRIGKWFLRPYKRDSEEEKYDRLSVSFMFFLRGEKTVCTTVDIAQHHPVERITNQYLYHIANNATSKNVILSPYGLRAAVTGVVFKSPHEQAVKTVIDEWQEFYPVDIPMDYPNSDEHENSDLPVPPVIEVSVGFSRVRMNYPSAYVLVPVENASIVKESESRQWNTDKRPIDGISHQGDFPSIGSFQDSVGLSVGEVTSNANSDVTKDCSNPNDLESTSSLVKKLIKRVVHASQLSSESELNGVVPHMSDGHSSPGGKNNWPKLNCQFRKARQVMNYMPLNDDDFYWGSGSSTQLDPRRKGDKQKQFLNNSFHRSSIEPSPPQNACTPQMPQSFPNYEQNVMMPMFQPPTPGFVNYSQYSMIPDESQKPLDTQTSIEPLFYSHGNEVPQVLENFQNHQDIDPGGFHFGITDAAIGNTAVGEIKEHISVWKKIKLPKGESNGEGKQRGMSKPDRPCLTKESLDCESSVSANEVRSIKRLKNSVLDIQKEHSWVTENKRRKIHEENLAAESAEPGTTGNIFPGSIQQIIPQHVRVGAVTGELAGMTVHTDPYEFEDDEKDGDTPSIIWPSNDNLETGELDLLATKHPHMSNLLKQTQDRPFPQSLSIFDDQNRLEKPTSSLMEERDLKVSEKDLNNIFDDCDDDIMDSKMTITKSTTVKFEPSGILSNLVSGDVAQPFPTGIIKGGGTNFGGLHAQDHMANSNEQLTSTSCSNIISVGTLGTIGGRMPGTTHGYGRIFEDEASEQNDVFSKQPLSKQPLADKYTPISLKSLSRSGSDGKMLNILSYTPSWHVQVEQYHNHSSIMHPMEPPEDVNYNMQPNDAPTPTPYSVSTPASVPQQSPLPPLPTPRTPSKNSPRTPRAGSSPATSTPNPATHGRFPVSTPLTSVSSSVAQSEIGGNCRASSIYVNLMLSDSVLNVFRDISFDQCPMCVCNDTGNIRGCDIDLGYLPSMADTSSDGRYPCSCGFSAIRNRNLSVGAGLFLEDELDIIGKGLEGDVIKAMDSIRKPSNVAFDALISFAVKQAQNPYTKLSGGSSTSNCQVYNLATLHDIMEACVAAINGGITVMETGTQQKIQIQHCKNIIHSWIDSRVMKTPNSADMYKMMVALKPFLQNAIQTRKRECHFNFIQHVNGPLIWREFCKDSTAPLEPLPVPMLLVGQSFDWVKVSPFALDYWEKLYLEPYAGTTNIWYLSFCPDTEHVFTAAKFFFTELSQIYDLCRLGTHKPLVNIRNMPDNAIFCISSEADVNDQRKTPCDSHNADSVIPNHTGTDTGKSVECYVNVCRDILLQLFGIVNLPTNTSTPIDSQGSQMPGSLPNSMGKPGSNRPLTPSSLKKKTAKDCVAQFTAKQNSVNNATLVLYFIDPFVGGNCSAFSIAIWKCYSEIVKSLPESRRNSVVIQLISLEDILQYPGSDHISSVSAARSLAFSTYLQCRYRMTNQTSVRTMTAFGPASTKTRAAQENKLKLGLPAVYSPPYVLAGSKATPKDALIAEKKTKECNILYVTYCLSHDQRWLIASATDQDGEILESFCVNIDVPPRRVSLRRKQRYCVKAEAIQKLWKLIIGVCTSTASLHWRIVIGRLGRLGHGEIQEWSKYLNRRNFSQLSKQVMTKCNQCKLNGSYKHPSIFSGCLTSMEPEGSFTILPDSVNKLPLFGRSSNTGQQVQLKTPEDASCTHINVFPTSSFVQTASGGTFQNENDDLLNGLGFSVFAEPGEQLEGIVDQLFETSPGGDTHQGDDMKPQPDRLISNDLPEEIALQQQPLAVGYMVSTAPTGPLPDSFWASCPHAQFRCPVFLRFALHVQVSSEEGQNMGTGSGDSSDEHHQLDSHKTAQVLRYVMENYNALSWLTCDPVSRDRRSCLPIHYYVLTRLYHAIKELT